MSTPEEKLSSPTRSGPARCTLEQLRARWGVVYRPDGTVISKVGEVEVTGIRLGQRLGFSGMNGWERWKVEKIEGKRVDLVQEVETR